jgi:DtxR family transcriptional regulator, Mn-dependent transcriptional regulator
VQSLIRDNIEKNDPDLCRQYACHSDFRLRFVVHTATRRAEDYLIALQTLKDEKVPAIPARIAQILDVSPPTVTLALRRIERDGLIRWAGLKEIELTDDGVELAESLVRRHRLIECWLAGVLKLDWATANEEAHKLEHAISPVVEARLMALMNFPSSCPHGNPIPGVGGERPPSERLSQLNVGDRVRIFRISELVESERTELLFYYEQGLHPDVEVVVNDVTADGIHISVADRELTLTREQANYLWVYSPATDTVAA